MTAPVGTAGTVVGGIRMPFARLVTPRSNPMSASHLSPSFPERSGLGTPKLSGRGLVRLANPNSCLNRSGDSASAGQIDGRSRILPGWLPSSVGS
jgi:hypothetical protein